MFDALRRMIIPIITIVLVFFVGMIVLEWGLGFSSRQQFTDANVAGAVNGEEIPWNAYQATYDNLYRQTAANTDEELSDAEIQRLQDQAWQQLVTDKLLSQQVAKMQFTVTEEELYSYLRNSPPTDIMQMQFFQGENGQFDYQKYLATMADPQAAPFWNSLMPYVRQDVRRLKLQEWVIQAAHVSEIEVRRAFVNQAESIKVEYVNVPFSLYANPTPEPTEEELQAYYDDNKDKYKVEERVVLDIAMIQKEPSEFDKENTRNLAFSIYDSLQAGSDFATLASIYSEDVSADNGGDLGWFPRGQMVGAFDSVSFALDSGDVSEPFETQFGWHIAKHYGYRTEETTDPSSGEKSSEKQAHVAHILLKVEASRETLDQYYNRLAELTREANSRDFLAVADELEIEVKTTAPTNKGANIQFIGSVERAQEFAFAEPVGSVSDVMENNSSIFALHISEYLPAGIAPLEQVREIAKRDWLMETLGTICTDTARAIEDAIKNGTEMKVAAERHGASYGETEMFTREGRVAGLGSAPVVIGAAFSLDVPSEMTTVVPFNQGAAIMRLVDRTQADLTQFNEKRDSIRVALTQIKQQELYGRWFQQLRENAQIVNNIQRQRDLEREAELL